MNQEHETTLSTFIAMTNAEVSVAKSFLQATGWDLNTAMDRFFTFGGDASKLEIPQQRRPQPQLGQAQQSQLRQAPPLQQPSLMSATANLIQQTMGGFFGAENSNNGNGNAQLSQTDADALLARQLAQSGQSNHNQNSNNAMGIRAPDASYQERMVGPYINQYGSSIYKQRKDAQQDFAKDWQRGPQNEKSSFLGALFSDPNYKFMGSLEEAKKKGSRDNKWVLVNIQDTENFCSHCLNRDIWKDKELGPVIRESFIFYQWMRRTDNAKRVINLYNPRTFPCIFIIDPSTGRQEYLFAVPDSPDKINTLKPKLLEFLDNYPNPKAKPKQSIPANSVNTDVNKAIQQSLAEQKEQQIKMEKAQEMQKMQQKQEMQKKEEMQKIEKMEKEQQKLDPQPSANDANATAIRIRMPNGSILQRLFRKDAKVNQLYIWIVMSLNGQQISLLQTMPRLKLDDLRNKTLQELGFDRTTLVCLYKE